MAVSLTRSYPNLWTDDKRPPPHRYCRTRFIRYGAVLPRHLRLSPPEKLEVIPDQGVKACLINLGNAYIELLEPLGDDSAIARFLSRNGEGLHHICLETDDVNQELLRLASQGLDLVDRAARPGIAGMIGFIHPKSTRGTLIELVQLKETA